MCNEEDDDTHDDNSNNQIKINDGPEASLVVVVRDDVGDDGTDPVEGEEPDRKGRERTYQLSF